MTHSEEPRKPKTGHDAARERGGAADPLRDALELVRRQDADALAEHSVMPRDADEFFASARSDVSRDASRVDPSAAHPALENVLRAELRAVPAPLVLDARVQDACATERTSQRTPTQRILRFAPWIAASVAAAAILVVFVQPMLFGSRANSPRLVLRVVDAPFDTQFDGRALLHARKSDVLLDGLRRGASRGEGR